MKGGGMKGGGMNGGESIMAEPKASTTASSPSSSSSAYSGAVKAVVGGWAVARGRQAVGGVGGVGGMGGVTEHGYVDHPPRGLFGQTDGRGSTGHSEQVREVVARGVIKPIRGGGGGGGGSGGRGGNGGGGGSRGGGGVRIGGTNNVPPQKTDDHSLKGSFIPLKNDGYWGESDAATYGREGRETSGRTFNWGGGEVHRMREVSGGDKRGADEPFL